MAALNGAAISFLLVLIFVSFHQDLKAVAHLS
jgi:hypothetical protein